MAYPYYYSRVYNPQRTWESLRAAALFLLSYSKASDAYMRHPELHYAMVWQGYCAARRLEDQHIPFDGFDDWYADDSNRSQLFDHVCAINWEGMPKWGAALYIANHDEDVCG